MSTAAITTAAADLARGIARLAPDERLQIAATVCRLLADALDDGDHGTDVACALLNAASDAEGNLRDLLERMAEDDAHEEAAKRAARRGRVAV